MLLKPPTIQIPAGEPFREDRLNRAEHAVVLTQLLRSIDEPFVLAIDASWGMGKTTFIKMWAAALKLQGFHYLSFNAWESDFVDDPLIPFIGEIQTGIDISTLDGNLQDRAKECLEKVKKLSGAVAKRLLPVAVKIATAGVLDLDKLSEEAIAGAVEKFVKEKIDKYGEDKELLEEFRKNLEVFTRLVSSEDAEGKRPLVFFIDELDRCRPTYAVQLLERLKHLFNVTGIVFVLALDREQILHSVRSLYGQGMDAHGYLKRFIDLEYRLPQPSGMQFTTYLFEKFGFHDFFRNRGQLGINETQELQEVFGALAEAFDLSLRDQEQCFTRLSLVLRTTPSAESLYPIMLVLLIALKAKHPTAYNRLITPDQTTTEIQKEVIQLINGSSAGRTLLRSNYGIALEGFLQGGFFTPEQCLRQAQKNLGMAQNDNLSKDKRDKADTLVSVFRHIHKGGGLLVPYLVKKIEVAERFV